MSLYNQPMMQTLIYACKRWYHFFKTGILQGLTAQLRYRNPAKSLSVVCVTGTDGKTTTATLVHHMMQSAGIKAGLISTVGAYINTDLIDTGFHVTSPNPADLHRFLDQMRRAGCTHVVLETTSHGIYQHRTWGIHPSLMGVTNITHEHLDYHLDWEHYVQAKRLLLLQSEQVYINRDDASTAYLNKLCWPKQVKVHSYASLQKIPRGVKMSIVARFPESYNQANATLAYLMAAASGVSDSDASKAIQTFEGVPGRMQIVGHAPVKVIVDFAHTPNSLENALTAVRKTLSSKGRLIVVFGCAGERDWQKRPLMGEIASRLADISIFTAEDPRHENIWSILRQMKDGVTAGHEHVLSFKDREVAIRTAITQLATPQDVVLITGKGHEKSMCFGSTEYPWDDVEVARRYLRS